MLRPRFIGLVLLLLGIFLIPGTAANACTMHRQATAAKHPKEKKMSCCNHSSAKHQHKKGNCTDANCTNGNCHTVSVPSLSIVNAIEVLPPLISGKAYNIRPNDNQLFAYAYTIWQPPRAG